MTNQREGSKLLSLSLSSEIEIVSEQIPTRTEVDGLNL